MASAPIQSSRTCCCIRARDWASAGLLTSTLSWRRVSIWLITARAPRNRASTSRSSGRSTHWQALELLPQEITRVFLNLISNGFYATVKRKEQATGPYDPILLAGTRNLGEQVEIRIRDNGTGIPPEVKEKMFEPFFTTKPAGEGTGLGLSLSHDIVVKQHRGSIEVDSSPGEFTEFRIVLPRSTATQSNDEARP